MRLQNEHMPDAVEAIYYTKGLSMGQIMTARRMHDAFLQHYSLSGDDCPLLVLDRSNWEDPFSLYS